MRVVSLQSGSAGNCFYVEGAGAALVIDAGISGKQARLRAARYDCDLAIAEGLLISHDHGDHSRSAGIFHRAFGLEVWMTATTRSVVDRSLGAVKLHRTFISGTTFTVGPFAITAIPTPHDGCDGNAFIIDDGSHRLGIMTDLGHVFAGLDQALATCDAAILESNHDPEMLANGPYPLVLQRRIRSSHGHLANEEAADLAARAGGRLRWLCLAHLSEKNNTPELATAAFRHRLGAKLPIHVATRVTPCGPFTL